MDNELLKKIGEKIKKVLKLFLKMLLRILLPVIIIIVILAACVYYITVDDGTYKENDWSSTGFGVAQNTKSAKISLEDGSLSTSYTPQELWDKMIKEGSRVDEYLKDASELAKLMDAEIITQYPDTRKDPTKDIDWEEILKTDSSKLQGIIKLKRNLVDGKTELSESELKKLEIDYDTYTDEYKANRQKEIEEEKADTAKEETDKKEEDKEKELEEGMLTYEEWMKNKGYTKGSSGWERPGEKITMSYVDPDTFESNMQAYRNSGSEADKKKAMSCFTLEKASTIGGSSINGISSFDKVLFIGDSHTVRLSSGAYLNNENKKKIENSIFRAVGSKNATYWLEHFSELPGNSEVNAVCVMLGVNGRDTANMKQLIDKLEEKYKGKNIYIQRVFPVGDKYTYADIEVTNSSITQYNDSISEYCEQKENVYFIDTSDGYINSQGRLEAGMTDDGLHFSNCDKWLENLEKIIIEQKESGVQAGKKDKEEEDKEDKENKEDKGDKEESNSGFLRRPDFSNNDAWRNPSNPYQYGQCTWFAGGRFYEIYGYMPCGGNRNWNGNCWVSNITEMYSEDFVKSDTPVPGAIFSGVGVNHVGVVIDVQGDKIIVQEGNLNGVSDNWDWATTECTNGIVGDGSNGDWIERTVTLSQLSSYYGGVVFANPRNGVSAATSSTSSRMGSQYYIKVATWKETTETYETDGDIDNQAYSSGPIYEMTATKINYYDMVKSYTMPFDYLWALMVITENKNFVMELADLIYNSDIEITVNDCVNVTTTVKDYTYQKDMYVKAEAKYKYEEEEERLYKKEGEVFENHTAKLTTVIKNNSVDAALTRANVWIVDYVRDYKYQGQQTSTSGSGEIARTDLNESFSEYKEDKTDLLNIKLELYQQGKMVTEFSSKYKSKNINWMETTTVTNQTTKYIGETPTIREKTSKIKKKDVKKGEFKYKEKNFVTLLLSHPKAKSNILNVSSWLFEILENNESTVEMVDLTKYLLYKVTDQNRWGVTEFDFSIFDPNYFNKADKGLGDKGWLFTITHEHCALWKYMIGEGDYSTVSRYVTEDKKNYIMYDDTGYNGTRNFGFGVCFWTSRGGFMHQALFSEKNVNITDAKYQITWQSQMPAEIADYVSLQIWKSIQTSVKQMADNSGVTLKQNQLDCLTDIAYQYGVGGATPTINGVLNLVRTNSVSEAALRAYAPFNSWKQRSTDRVNLFIDGKYVAADGTDLTKYATSSLNGDLMSVCKQVTEHYLSIDAYYSVGGDLISKNIEKCWNHQAICCATYTTMCLYKAGLLTENQINSYNYHWTGSGGIPDMLAAAGWKKVSSPQAGDVLIDPGVHVAICAGGDMVYDQNTCTNGTSSAPAPFSAPFAATYQAWRAP